MSKEDRISKLGWHPLTVRSDNKAAAECPYTI